MTFVTSMPYDPHIGFGEPDTYGEWMPIHPIYSSSRKSNSIRFIDEPNDASFPISTVEAETDDTAGVIRPIPYVASLARLPPPIYLTELKDQLLITPTKSVAPVTLPPEAIRQVPSAQWGNLSLPPA